jgi:RNA polymerase sigma-70 factor (ECF subfamily)
MENNAKCMSDEDLARRTQAGSVVCYEELVRRYQGRLYQFLRLKVGHSHDAEDLAQAVLIKAYRKIGQYNPAYRFATWLYTMARRDAASFYRARKPSEPLDREPMDLRDPRETVVRADDRAALWEWASERLPESQFSALWFRYAEDMTVAEVAKTLKKSVANVKVLLHRGREALTQSIARTAHSPPPPPLSVPPRPPSERTLR